MDKETQYAICSSFSEAKEKLILDKERIIFNGSYRPNDDEFLCVENFRLADEIKDAIRNPLGVTAFQQYDNAFPEIKAIFVGERIETEAGEHFNIAFQRFRKEQYISTKGFNLFFVNNTFSCKKEFGISIAESIDCFYTNEELQFISFFFVRQIFDLGEYYRSATDGEVTAFATNTHLQIDNAELFKNMADTWIRRKIALLNDSKVLENFPPNEIAKRAAQVGVSIIVRDDKIVVPNEKPEIKVLLGFLDEEAYKGPFSQKTFLANSKRQVTV